MTLDAYTRVSWVNRWWCDDDDDDNNWFCLANWFVAIRNCQLCFLFLWTRRILENFVDYAQFAGAATHAYSWAQAPPVTMDDWWCWSAVMMMTYALLNKIFRIVNLLFWLVVVLPLSLLQMFEIDANPNAHDIFGRLLVAKERNAFKF